GYLPLIQIRIMQVIMEAFGRIVPLNVDLFENIKDLDEDRLFSVIENELEMEIDKNKRCSVRTPDDIINLMTDIMTEDEIRVYYMKVSLANLIRMRDERIEDGFDTEGIDDAIMDLELELMVEENDEAKAIYTEMMKMFDDDSEQSEDEYDEEESDEEYERKFRESLNNIAQTLSVEQIVYLWNEGIELNTLDDDDLYIYKEVLAIHGVSVSEMEDADAIDRRLMIQYDVENNLIRCVE
ncbi:MAG: hypothetical protein IJN52_11845, partial [Bacteroidales bacterium]|nr:hypothetical protein [Bacteroidales bacterium]